MQILGLLLAVFLVAGVVSASEVQKPKPCQIKYKCSDIEKPVWATTNGRDCLVFRNDCQMSSANCQRLNENKPQAKKINKKKCQELCKEQMCMALYAPVCGSYNGNLKTFGNSCEMKTYICSTGETYTLINNEACPSPTQSYGIAQ